MLACCKSKKELAISRDSSRAPGCNSASGDIYGDVRNSSHDSRNTDSNPGSNSLRTPGHNSHMPGRSSRYRNRGMSNSLARNTRHQK